MSEYITVADGKITGHYCGPDPGDCVIVPDGFNGFVGQSLEEFDAGWRVKPFADRVKAGLIPTPEGFVLDGDSFREMSVSEKVASGLIILTNKQILRGENIEDKRDVELMRDGIIKAPKGYKIVDAPDEPVTRLLLVAKTLLEQVADGDMTQQTADVIQAINIRSERDALMAGCDWTQVNDSPLNDAMKGKWQAYRQALRDVPAQGGFPWSVEWPVNPGEAKI